MSAGVGLGSADSTRGRNAAAEVGAHGGGAVDDMLAESPDAVIISSATGDHPAHLEASVRLGVPVLCEKPIALTLEESQAAVDAARRVGVTLQVGFQRRYDAGFAESYGRVKSGELGDLYSLRFVSHDRQPPPEHALTGKGTIFRDLHVPDFDLARWLTGADAEEVVAAAAARTEYRYLSAHGDADTTAILMRMTNGVIVTITGARHNPAGHDVRAELFGSRGAIAVGLDTRTVLGSVGPNPLQADHGPRYDDFLDRFRDAFAAESLVFLDVATGTRPNPCPGIEAVHALRIVVAAEHSRRRGTIVRLAEVDS